MKKRILLLTGNPGVGKTTVVMEVVDSLKEKGYNVGGIVSREVRSDNVRTGFEIIDLMSERQGWLARVTSGTGPRVGKYRVEMHDLESIGVRAIIDAVDGSDVVVIDEIGPMELFSGGFKEAVKKALECAKLVLCVVHRRAHDPILDSLKNREDAELFEVTLENRSSLSRLILERAFFILSTRSEG